VKCITFREEAERLNVPVEAISKAYRKCVDEGKIHGIIDEKNGEIICYKPEEIENLVKCLNSSKRIYIQEIANELNLKTDQTRLVISKLLNENKISGSITSDGKFISDTVIKNLVVKQIEKDKRIDFHELSSKLMIPEEKIKRTIKRLSEDLIAAITPYRQIKLSDLSHELKLPEPFLTALLKVLISNGQIAGSLDMVSRIFIREQTIRKSIVSSDQYSLFKAREKTKRREGEIKKDKVFLQKPSSAWYLVPIFFGIVGGLIGYVAVKDDDKDMANSLLSLGIVMTFVSIIIIWAFYSWLINQLL